LTVSGDIVVRRIRRLPIKGDVLVAVGEAVQPQTIVARAMLPGLLQTIKLSEKLSVEPKDAPQFFRLKPGDPVAKGDLVAETKGLFGKFMKTAVHSEFTGTIESVSEVTGNVLVREPSTPVDINAYLEGKVSEVIPGEGAVIETRGAMVQGIFGVGGERQGSIRIAVGDPSQVLAPADISSSDAGKILVGGAGVTYDALVKAAECDVIGLIAGGVKDSDLTRYLGYDIGVAITGTEAIPLTLLVTEGFGYLAMASRTFSLLKSLDGATASLNGATQIRAGVIRPEIIVPSGQTGEIDTDALGAFELKLGTPIRVIREPFFGRIGTVTELPAQLQTVESGTEVRVLRAMLDGGQEVLVPRANVEIIATD
jgi:hypothetical protein